MTISKIKTKGMHCSSCEMLVTDELKELEGVFDAKADHKSGVVEVEYDDSKVKVDKIKKVIQDEGYETE